MGWSSGHVKKVSVSVCVTCVAASCVRWVIEWHVWWLLVWSDMTGAILLCPGIWNNKAISRCFCIFKTKKNSKTWGTNDSCGEFIIKAPLSPVFKALLPAHLLRPIQLQLPSHYWSDLYTFVQKHRVSRLNCIEQICVNPTIPSQQFS